MKNKLYQIVCWTNEVTQILVIVTAANAEQALNEGLNKFCERYNVDAIFEGYEVQVFSNNELLFGRGDFLF